MDLPSLEERKEILTIHLRKMKRDPANFKVDKLAQFSTGFSGAELEQVIVAALHDSFFENREVRTLDIAHNIEITVPLSETMREPIEAMRQWSKHRARNVSSAPYNPVIG